MAGFREVACGICIVATGASSGADIGGDFLISDIQMKRLGNVCQDHLRHLVTVT